MCADRRRVPRGDRAPETRVSLAAADAYSYLHLLLVSGIIVSAIGLKAAVGHVAEPPAFGVPSCRSAAIRRSERAIVRCS